MFYIYLHLISLFLHLTLLLLLSDLMKRHWFQCDNIRISSDNIGVKNLESKYHWCFYLYGCLCVYSFSFLGFEWYCLLVVWCFRLLFSPYFLVPSMFRWSFINCFTDLIQEWIVIIELRFVNLIGQFSISRQFTYFLFWVDTRRIFSEWSGYSYVFLTLTSLPFSIMYVYF